jgi:hypothetical protein
MTKKVIFTNIIDNFELEMPLPSSKSLPQWYKELKSYMNGKKVPDGKGETQGTIKKCIPVFDVITAGYLIVTHVDIFVSKKEDNSTYYEWALSPALDFHPIEQAPTHPNTQNAPYPKFINPWAIQTPKGYSTLFIKPTHRDTPISIFPGLVDTDNYIASVNLPFVLTDPSFQGLIPKGTAIAQIIFIKRENWISEQNNSDARQKEINMLRNKLRTVFFDSYKTQWWQKKSYK